MVSLSLSGSLPTTFLVNVSLFGRLPPILMVNIRPVGKLAPLCVWLFFPHGTDGIANIAIAFSRVEAVPIDVLIKNNEGRMACGKRAR